MCHNENFKILFSQIFACRKCEGNVEEAVEKEEKLCDEVETVG